MNSINKRWVSNASANVAGGLFGALYSIILPAILLRTLTKNDFSLWNLIIQVVLYVQVFSGGLQQVIARHISSAGEKDDVQDQIHTVGAAWRISLVSAGVGVVLSIAFSFIYPHLFSNIETKDIVTMTACVAIVGVSAAFQLLSLVPAGVFVGKHNNIKWVFCVALSRLLILISIYIASKYNTTIIIYSIIFSIGGLLVIPTSLFLLKSSQNSIFQSLKTTSSRLKEMVGYSITMSFWNASVLLIGGLSTALVAIYETSQIGAYALAIAAVNVMNGLLQAVLSPIGVNSAALMVKSDGGARVDKILTKTTKYLSWAFFAIYASYLYLGSNILNIWVGNEYEKNVFKFLTILILSNSIRCMFLPLSMVLISIKNPKSGLIGTIFEGVIVLTMSIALGSLYGAMGIAYASLIGAISGSIFVYFVTMLEMKDIIKIRFTFIMNSIFYPCLSLLILALLNKFIFTR